MTAAEMMTKDVATIPSTASVADAIDALETLHVRHLPVVDASGVLVGMLSDRDVGPLMRTFIAESAVERMPVPPSERLVADIMSTDPIGLTEDATTAEIIDTLTEERIGAVPIVDDADHVIGIVSYADVLRALRPSEPVGSAARGTRVGPAHRA